MGANLGKKVIPDSQTGLTPKDRKLVRETWHSFSKSDSDYAMHVLQWLFVQNPDFLHVFPRFKGKQVISLPDDAEFRAHSTNICNHFTSMIDCLDDAQLLESLIRKNARAHTERPGVEPDHFRVFGNCVIDLLALKLENNMTPDAVAAWEKLFAFIVNVTTRVYEQEKLAPAGPRAADAGCQKQDATESFTRHSSRTPESASATPSRCCSTEGSPAIASATTSAKPSTESVLAANAATGKDVASSPSKHHRSRKAKKPRHKAVIGDKIATEPKSVRDQTEMNTANTKRILH